MAKHPIQRVDVDESGVPRFRANPIVRLLLDSGNLDMNQISRLDFSDEDRQQFAQLIGYSLDGYAELSYASDESVQVALSMAEGLDEKDARIKCGADLSNTPQDDTKRPTDMFVVTNRGGVR